MITDGILFLIYGFVSGFISLLPTGLALPSDMTDAFAFFIGQANAWSAIVPVTTFFIVAGLFLGFEGGILAFRSITWIIKIIRG